ncbi:MAG: HD domain-containing protein [Lentisphaeria bacterium]|nr:HD domain-containing protein [Lentisphaeria bacterium]
MLSADLTPYEKIVAYAQGCLETDASCHDWDHTLRVLKSALDLGRIEGTDESVVTVAAILHDIARPVEMRDHGRSDHAFIGAQMAYDYLAAEGVRDDVWRRHVADCIRTHRYRSRTGEAPATVEAKVLFDADKLDSLGAIGLARAFHFAGKTGARVHNSAEEALAGESYGREDSAYREYLVKLKYLPEAMLTKAGRETARARHEFMKRFFDELDAECF